MFTKQTVLLAALVLVFVLAAGCAPGNERWASVDSKAGFWAGLWHGLIIIVTFVVSLFTRDVGIYEANNAGWGYNIGFLLGCMISLGGGARASRRRRKKVVAPDPDRIARRVERGVRDGLRRAFADRAETFSDADWETLGRRIEERVREELRDVEKGDK
ncbi:MAG: hypothetical protein R6X12_00875 [bacterium]